LFRPHCRSLQQSQDTLAVLKKPTSKGINEAEKKKDGKGKRVNRRGGEEKRRKKRGKKRKVSRVWPALQPYSDH